MYLARRKRFQWNRVAFVICGLLTCYIYKVSFRNFGPISAPWTGSNVDENEDEFLKVETREIINQTAAVNATEVEEIFTVTERPKITHCIVVDPELPMPTTLPVTTLGPTPAPGTTISNTSGTDVPRIKGEYPQDLFSVEQRRQGWIFLHIFGMVYVFVALAIVCDEFFVPALGVIINKLQISDDVAGATFMAAGGSAPELFTSLIGVFISHSNVGIGTIVGSAVFNILFVIGMCALFSREVLHLTWWPLFRDVSFYILDLMLLIMFFLDNFIDWWESVLLLCAYGTYVCFMKYNSQVEQWTKKQLSKRENIVKVMALEDRTTKGNGSIGGEDQKQLEDNNTLKPKPALQRGGSSASLHNSTMRNTIFQLMIHTLDPLGEVKFKDKAEIMNNMAKAKVESVGKEGDKTEEEKTELPNTVNVQVTSPTEPSTSEQNEAKEKEDNSKENQKTQEGGDSGGGSSGSSEDNSDDDDDDDDDDSDSDEASENDEDKDEDDEEENDEPLSLQWPGTRRKQATYLFLLPIVLPLWLTVPDVRNLASRRFFPVTFLGSIIWIAVFSYLMVWWAHQVGETIGISEEIMGLTILAAGTSIPDLITSVIVARKGLGDMAVSSSVGSNIFDITVGLPVPWLLFSMFGKMRPVPVSSNGLFCAIVLLFLMLLFVIISIAASKWKMSKWLGCTMFGLYFVFLIVSVMLENRIITCPITI
ncbi:sodium/potassium/calcium exchanger 1 [Latimeria chalumnae]|uniref:sodium/potassium/calcium exchanger 1 n=1 Tax=Latimeria chalumnae TaxID=7897 RepID=UPI00313DB19E